MAWRFAPSKFKNTTPRQPKKEETLFDVPVGTLLTGNNGIQCSPTHMAFGLEGEGGKLGVLPVDARGRRQRGEMKIICAHAEPVNDFAFFPYDPTLIATCSREEKLKLWRCGDAEDNGTVSDPDSFVELDFGSGLECLAPHRTASQIISVATSAVVAVVDVHAGKCAREMHLHFDERVDSMSWSPDGKLLAMIGDKGRHATVFDPRSDKPEVADLNLHTGTGRESRIIFVSDNQVVSSGFTSKRVQEIILSDVRSSKHIFAQEYASSTSVLMPLYDDDTKLLFLLGKGTNKMIMTELQEKSPQISPVYTFGMQTQTIGACLGSKLSVDVMSGEVARVFQLAQNSITPIPCIVPRRSYRDFHKELFPDTIGITAGCTCGEWLSGSNDQPARVSLDPEKKQVPTFAGGELTAATPPSEEATASTEAGATGTEEKENKERKRSISKPPPESRTSAVRRRSPQDITNRAERSKVTSIVGVVSKYRHVETVSGAKHGAFFNIRNINTRLPTESNGFCVSSKYAAVPLAGPSGVVSVIDITNIVKLPDGVVDGVQNRAPLTDLTWNPFDPEVLACALDIGEINFWRIENLETPLVELEQEDVLKVTPNERIISIRYNPVAADVLAVASVSDEMTLSIWNLENRSCIWQSRAHGDSTILAMAWSADGKKLATVGRDFNVFVFEPLSKDDSLLVTKTVLESPRAARILFACDDAILILVHFTKASQRQFTLLDSNTLAILHTQSVDTSSQPLIPFYDYDSSVLFLTGKGDRQITMFEIIPTAPYILPLSSASFPQGHQAIAFHHKVDCDVKIVEFQKGWRLTEKMVEQLSYRIPRLKKDAFQTDIFPDALVTWLPAMSASEWVAGSDQQPLMMDLCPEGFHRLLVPTPAARQASHFGHTHKAPRKVMGEDPKEDMRTVQLGWSKKIEVDHTLEQDKMEGVDEDEWKEAEDS